MAKVKKSCLFFEIYLLESLVVDHPAQEGSNHLELLLREVELLVVLLDFLWYLVPDCVIIYQLHVVAYMMKLNPFKSKRPNINNSFLPIVNVSQNSAEDLHELIMKSASFKKQLSCEW